MAERIRRELKIDVDMVRGRYGVFKVVVDGDTVVDGGKAAILGILPPVENVVAAVAERMKA